MANSQPPAPSLSRPAAIPRTCAVSNSTMVPTTQGHSASTRCQRGRGRPYWTATIFADAEPRRGQAFGNSQLKAAESKRRWASRDEKPNEDTAFAAVLLDPMASLTGTESKNYCPWFLETNAKRWPGLATTRPALPDLRTRCASSLPRQSSQHPID